MKTGLSLSELAREIEARANQKKDFIAPVGKLAMAAVVDGDATAKARAEDPKASPVIVPELVIQNGDAKHFTPNKVAHQQIAEYTGVPYAYYQRMQQEAPELLARNVNNWLAQRAQTPAAKDGRRMVRTLGGTARALLSDKFRPLENEDLAEAILPVLLEKDLIVISSQITETRLYIKAVDKQLLKDVPTGRKMGDGSHVFFDTVSPGITISNSEVGHGALSIETGVYTKVCTNLAMFGTNMRKFHTGSRAELSDEVYALLTDKTKRLTDAAIWNQTRDLVAAAFNEGRFNQICAKLEDAAQQKISATDTVEVIERVGRKFSLGEGERKGILARLIEGGDLTRYGVHSAITRHSADIDDYDRATELERIGGQVIELDRSQWEVLAQAA